MGKNHKRYEIDSFEKLINIATDENFEGLSTDMLLWLHYTMDVIKALRNKMPEETKGKTNWQVMQSVFIWVDDGKNELKEFSVKDLNTGEISRVKLKHKK